MMSYNGCGGDDNELQSFNFSLPKDEGSIR